MTELATSASLANPGYWWYSARAELLRTVFEPHLPTGQRMLDVGSADGPSVSWTDGIVERTPVDIDPEGLPDGGVCASIMALPFQDRAFGGISAFDVIEHVDDDGAAVRELLRVLAPGGVLLVTVPAYQWAWSPFDVEAGHFRRYTRRRIVRLLRREGVLVTRATYAFAATFPLFVLDRLSARLGLRKGEDPSASRLPAWAERSLLRLASLDRRVLERHELPFGSSVLVVGYKRP
jgi:SAM-dependent methyltransferase